MKDGAQKQAVVDHQSIAYLRSTLASGTLDEFTVRDVRGSDSALVKILSDVLLSPESIRHGRVTSGVFTLAAQRMGALGRKEGVPVLRQFLASRIGADTLPSNARPFGDSVATGAYINLFRAEEALFAARSLYQLGDWQIALPALERLVTTHAEGTMTHLPWTAWLDARRYAKDTVALESTAAYLRRTCASPIPEVRAHAARSLAPLDPDSALSTALTLVETGPDAGSRTARYLAMHKVFALWALAENPTGKALTALRIYAQSDRPLVQAQAREILDHLAHIGR